MPKNSSALKDLLLKEIRSYQENGRYNEVINRCNELIKEDAESIEAYYYRAGAYYDLKLYENSLQDFRVLARIQKGSDFNVLNIIVNILSRNGGSNEDIISACSDVIASFPEKSKFYALRAKSYVALGFYNEALDDYKNYIELQRSGEISQDIYHQKALCYFNLQRHQDALREVNAQIAILNLESSVNLNIVGEAKLVRGRIFRELGFGTTEHHGDLLERKDSFIRHWNDLIAVIGGDELIDLGDVNIQRFINEGEVIIGSLMANTSYLSEGAKEELREEIFRFHIQIRAQGLNLDIAEDWVDTIIEAIDDSIENIRESRHAYYLDSVNDFEHAMKLCPQGSLTSKDIEQKLTLDIRHCRYSEVLLDFEYARRIGYEVGGEFYYHYALILHNDNQQEAALKWMLKAIQDHECYNDGESYIACAAIYSSLNRHESAIENLKIALEQFNYMGGEFKGEVYLRLAQQYLFLDQHDKALENCNLLIGEEFEQGDNGNVYVVRCQANFGLQNYLEALDDVHATLDRQVFDPVIFKVQVDIYEKYLANEIKIEGANRSDIAQERLELISHCAQNGGGALFSLRQLAVAAIYNDRQNQAHVDDQDRVKAGDALYREGLLFINDDPDVDGVKENVDVEFAKRTTQRKLMHQELISRRGTDDQGQDRGR